VNQASSNSKKGVFVMICQRCNSDVAEERYVFKKKTCKDCINKAHREWAHKSGRNQPKIVGCKYDFKDQKFNNWTVKYWIKKGKWTYWVCECICGNIREVYQTHLINGNSKSCGCTALKTGSDHPLWKGCGDISGQFFSAIRAGAKSRNLEFNITVEESWELFLKQNKKCALSGIDITINPTRDEETTASLDRIDNTKGYEPDNIQWLHKYVNMMKSSYSQELFLQLCSKITCYNKDRISALTHPPDKE
jgi:hypothetical protein